MCLLSVAGCRAQEYVISLRHWDMADGLSHRQVNAGLRTRDGFMWLATANGLCRFDGQSFKTYNADNAGLPFNNIQYLVQDDTGMLWLMGYSGVNNLCVFDPRTGKASRRLHSRTRDVSVISGTTDGRVIIQTNGRSPDFYVYSTRTGYRQLKVPVAAPYSFYFASPSGTIWLRRSGREMYEYSLDGRILHRWLLPGAQVKAYNMLLPWYPASFTGPRGTGKIAYQATGNGDSVRALAYAPLRKSDKLDHILNTGLDGIIWRQGVLYHPLHGIIKDFSAEGWDDLQNDARCSFVIAPGEIWVGASFGLYQISIRRSHFKKYFYDATPRQDHDNGYRGLLRVGDRLLGAHEVWGVFGQHTATNDSSIVYEGRKTGNSRYTMLLRLQDSSIIFAAHRRLFRADSRGHHAVQLQHDDPLQIWCGYQWDAETLLLGTERGLLWYDLKANLAQPFTGYNGFEVLQEAMVNDIAAQPDGSISICAGNGLYFLDRSGCIKRRCALELAGSNYLPALRFFRCQHLDKNQYWLSTAEGLIRWDKTHNSYKRYTTASGLSNNTIYAAYPDASGRLWLPSDYGLMCLNTGTGRVTTYLERDGLSSNEFNRTSQYRSADGTLYLGSINGVTAFHPDQFPAPGGNAGSNSPARLAITSFRQSAGGHHQLTDRTQALLQSRKILLAPGDAFFSIELALLDFTDPTGTRYLWKIDGIHSAWNIQSDRTIRLSRPASGNYTLRIKAISGNGEPSANEISLQLLVAPPFYRKAAFIISVCLLVLSAAALMLIRRSRRSRREQQRLEAEVALRTRALRETLAQKQLLLKEVHHRVKNNLQIVTSLQRLQGAYSADPTVKDAMEESVNRILSIAFIHQALYQQEEGMQGVDIRLFLRTFAEHNEHLFARPDVRIQVVLDVTVAVLDVDTAVPVGIIINELLTNSYKHAFAGRNSGTIRIALTESEDKGSYILHYSDDGIGLPGAGACLIADAETLGMTLMLQLSEQLCGSLQYYFDSGSHFTLKFFNYQQRSAL